MTTTATITAIEQKAYEHYQQRLGKDQSGTELDDWFKAESEILGKGDTKKNQKKKSAPKKSKSSKKQWAHPAGKEELVK